MPGTDFSGSCHCGATGFVYRTTVVPSAWSVRACQCRFCRCHDALSTSDPLGTLEFSATEPEQLQRYRFALKTADFLLCRRCGVYLGAVIEAPEGRFGIINTHALDMTPEAIAEAGSISYAGEAAAGRVGRRVERWTPVSKVPW